jgi:hypothetical protein
MHLMMRHRGVHLRYALLQARDQFIQAVMAGLQLDIVQIRAIWMHTQRYQLALGMRMDDLIPISMKFTSLYIHAFHFLFSYFATRWIFPPI